MGRIKIKITTGQEIEKNVINAFTAENNTYVVIDNQVTGSMGLPIILVSKLVNNKLLKIESPDEWQKTKEFLKLIIASGQVKYVNIPNEVVADEIYSTQLTLPVESFDVIKKNYKPEEVPASNEFIPNIEITPIGAPVKPNPMESMFNNQTVAPAMPATAPVMPAAPVVEPVMPTIEMPVVNPVPVIETPSAPVMPTPFEMPAAPVQNVAGMSNAFNTMAPEVEQSVPKIEMPEVKAPVIETPVMPAPIKEEVSKATLDVNSDKYKDMKETFLKSCENMFDALVRQFENKE